MKIAYLLYRYPALSQAFVLREVQGLRRLGIDVEPYSLRKASAEHLLAGADREEAERTIAFLPVNAPALVAAHMRAVARHPVAYIQTLAAALREAGADPRTLAAQLANFVFAVLMWSRLDRAGITHVHTHFAGTPNHIAALVARLGNAARRNGQPRWSWSVTIHGPVEFLDAGTYRLRERGHDAALIAYVSDFARRQLLTALDAEDWSKLELVRCGIDPDGFNVSERDHDPDRPLRLLTVGRQVSVKAPEVLVEAVARLRERGHDLHLTMVGDGPLHADLRALASRLGAADAITFAGALGQDDIPDQYRRADVFCLSSVAESLPVVLMEAMASGVPVVSSNVGGISELVLDGETGLIAPPGDVDALADAIERLVVDPELRARLALAGRERVLEEFVLDRWVAELARLFRARVASDEY